MRMSVRRHPREDSVVRNIGWRYRHLFLLTLVAVTFACGGSGKVQPPDSRQTEQAVAGEPREPEQSPLDTVSLDALLDSIRVIKGQFIDYQGVYWEFSGNRAVFSSFNRFKDSALVRLVDCLDRTDPVAATANGEPVALGFMCYKALEQVAYYESDYEDPTTEVGWPGILDADASETQLIAAKRAWQKVVTERSYVLH